MSADDNGGEMRPAPDCEAEQPSSRDRASDAAATAYTKQLAYGTWVIAIAAVATFLTSLLSWIVIRSQLNEMRSAGIQTDKLIAVSQSQADAINKQASISQMQLAAVQRADRPYLLFDFSHGPEFDGTEVYWNVYFTNTGRTAARKFTHEGYLRIGQSAFKKTPTPIQSDDVQPGQELFFTVVSQERVTSDEYKKLASKDFEIGLLINIRYQDETTAEYGEKLCVGWQANGIWHTMAPQNCRTE